MIAPQLIRTDAEISERFASLHTLEDVANLLEIPPTYLRTILYTRGDRARYHRFSIPKRTGGSRELESPPPALKLLQQKLNRVFSLAYSAKPAVHGYVRTRSIRSNAEHHLRKRWVLNIDLEDFFPSIHLGRIRGALMASPFRLPQRAATVLAQVCTTRDGHLPQGGPTSPILSNIVCARLDGQMMALAKRYGLSYSRYCDDITLSTRQPTFPVEVASVAGGWVGECVMPGGALQEVIEGNGFKVNRRKSRMQSLKCHQEVTGITVNEFPNIPRAYIHALRGLLHAWHRYGDAAAASEFTRRQKLARRMTEEEVAHFKAVVLGRIQYVGFVRGHRDPVYCRLRASLHSVAPDLIGPPSTPDAYRVHRAGNRGDHWQRLFQRWQNSVPLLAIHTETGREATGSAFAVNPRYLASAAHNLKGTARVLLAAGEQEVATAALHARGPSDVDCAMLAVEHGLSPLQCDRRRPVPGESVAVIGFASVPGRQPGRGLFVGTVESLRTNYSRTLDLIHVSIPSGGGLSGAPMLDTQGRVLGVVIESVHERTAEDVPGREYCTVLPISYVMEIDCSGEGTRLPIRY